MTWSSISFQRPHFSATVTSVYSKTLCRLTAESEVIQTDDKSESKKGGKCRIKMRLTHIDWEKSYNLTRDLGVEPQLHQAEEPFEVIWISD